MYFALDANFKVDNDSWKHFTDGEIIAIIVVFQFPPKESSSNLVNLEFL